MMLNGSGRCIQDLITSIEEEDKARLATIFLDNQGRKIQQYTYADLNDRCLVAAKNLTERTRQGDIVLLSIDEQADFVISFFACLMSGRIPAPIQAVRHKNDKQGIDRIQSILRSGQAAALLLSDSVREIVKQRFVGYQFNMITAESLQKPIYSHIELPTVSASEIAYIQYTSGSTMHPKGVCLTHEQVLNNLEKMVHTFNRQVRPCVVGWLPFHHDMGLVGHLFTALYEQGTGVFLPPASFLADPNVWLQAIHDFKGNIAAAPAFAIDECIRRVAVEPMWDLSGFKYFYVGSETVSEHALVQFARRLESTGFKARYIYPVYGLAESTLLAAGGSKHLEALSDDFIDKPVGGYNRRLTPYTLDEPTTLFIRDPETGALLQDGQEGEIVIKAPYIFSGYLDSMGRKPSISKDELQTGDLGFINNHSLYITGRRKEIVIVRGVNYHAEDLEGCVKLDHEFLRTQDKTACVSQVVNDKEQLIIFQELQRHTPREYFSRIVEKIQGNLLEGFGIKAHAVHLIPQGLLPKTRNHKIARGQCVAKHATGALQTLHSQYIEDHIVTENSATPERDLDDPVVIVGMACRFPGGADDLNRFWDMLIQGEDGITKVPPSRWDNTIFFDRQPAVPGKMNTRWSGLTKGIDQFDPALFGISPYEAPELDPQQRMLLETSWRLLEHTGWKKDDIKQSDTGVFVGISNNDYLYLKIKLSENLDGFNAYSGLGNANSVAATRQGESTQLFLRGPR